jgi:hypothetical protein
VHLIFQSHRRSWHSAFFRLGATESLRHAAWSSVRSRTIRTPLIELLMEPYYPQSLHYTAPPEGLGQSLLNLEGVHRHRLTRGQGSTDGHQLLTGPWRCMHGVACMAVAPSALRFLLVVCKPRSSYFLTDSTHCCEERGCTASEALQRQLAFYRRFGRSLECIQ